MRDPKRIKRILKKIETIWEFAPDLRFNQLLLNVETNPDYGLTETYDIEDDFLEKKLDEFILRYDIKISGGWKS